MKANNISSQVKKQLIAFFAEMHDWETNAYAAMLEADDTSNEAFDSARDAALASLDSVFQKYCTDHSSPTERISCVARSPEYQPEFEQVLNVNVLGDVAEVLTERVKHKWRLGEKNLYVLKLVDGEWRIDAKKQLKPNGRKVSVPL